MKGEKHISESEWLVMEVLWEHAPIGSRQVIKHLEDRGWRPTTIRTLLNRLVKKGFVGYEETEPAFSYHPLVNRDDLVAEEANHMLTKLYKGNLSSMMAGFIKSGSLTEDDYKELAKLLKDTDKE